MTDDDGIRFTKYGTPQLKYPEHACVECGAEITSLGGTCENCINRSWWKEIHLRQAEALREHPSAPVDLAWDTNARARHIALMGYPKRAFCGSKLSQAVKKRTAVNADKLPMTGVCPSCRAALEKAKGGGKHS